jgi:hypothetical protein
MKKIVLCAAIPALLALTACGGSAETAETTEANEAPADAAAVVDDDNDTAEPVAAPAAEEAPHDETVPHDH